MLSCCLWWVPDIFQNARSKLWDRWVAVRKTASVPTRPHVQDIHCRIKIFTAAAAKRRYFISIGGLGCQLALLAARSGHLDSWRGAGESPQSP